MGAKGRLRKNPLRDKIPSKIPYLIQSIAQQIKHFFLSEKNTVHSNELPAKIFV